MFGLYFFINDRSVVKISIYPSGGPGETYIFKLKPNHILQASFESDSPLKSRTESKKVQLSADEFEVLFNTVKKIKENKNTIKRIMVLDGWDFSIDYRGEKFELNYTGTESEEVNFLIEELIRRSPVPVDLHGWS